MIIPSILICARAQALSVFSAHVKKNGVENKIDDRTKDMLCLNCKTITISSQKLVN